MALEHIEYGSLASSEIMNNNFEYLDNRISSVAEMQATESSNIYSHVANINTNLSQQDTNLAADISSLQEDVNTLTNAFNAQNNAPDYSRAIGISLPYTVQNDGYVYAGVDGIDAHRYVYVNGQIVHGHCGYSGGKSVYSGSIFRVSNGDIVTCSKIMGQYCFYPMKGVNNSVV